MNSHKGWSTRRLRLTQPGHHHDFIVVRHSDTGDREFESRPGSMHVKRPFLFPYSVSRCGTITIELSLSDWHDGNIMNFATFLFSPDGIRTGDLPGQNVKPQ